MRGAIRLDASSLNYKRPGDIATGNLVYVHFDEGELKVGMRVARLNGGAPAVLVFDYRNQNGEVMHALMGGGTANRHCIDWGVKPVVCWHHPLTEEAPNNSRRLSDGTILVFQDRLALRTYFGHGTGDAMHFDLKTGHEVELAEPFATIAEWSLGVRSIEGAFIQLAAYPTSHK